MACSLYGLSKDVTCPEDGGIVANQGIGGIISGVSFNEETGTTSFLIGGRKLQIMGVNLPKDALKDGQEISIDFGKTTTITIKR